VKRRRPSAKRDFLDLGSLSADELARLLGLAARLKAELRAGLEHPYLRGRTLAMIFQKPSLRTRLTFETGMAQLGGPGPCFKLLLSAQRQFVFKQQS